MNSVDRAGVELKRVRNNNDMMGEEGNIDGALLSEAQNAAEGLKMEDRDVSDNEESSSDDVSAAAAVVSYGELLRNPDSEEMHKKNHVGNNNQQQQQQMNNDDTNEEDEEDIDNEHKLPDDLMNVAAAQAVAAVGDSHVRNGMNQQHEQLQLSQQQSQQQAGGVTVTQHVPLGNVDMDEEKTQEIDSNGNLISRNNNGRRTQQPLAGSAEWKQQRKDSHKEVERRRRENINTAINRLSSLLPVRESSKAAILARAAEYIQKLKETENANIEKWTLQKLLNEQTTQHMTGQNEKLQEELGIALKENEQLKNQIRILENNNNNNPREKKDID